MKYLVSALVLVLYGVGANAAAHNSRPAMANRIISAPRYTASVNQLSGTKTPATSSNTSAVTEDTTEETEEKEEVDMREAERNACINNNIGVGNTFVWASKYSDTSGYATMIEDVEHPENNVCFVRVELSSSNESRIKVSDIDAKYFVWGEPIKCGSWVSKKKMEERILDAKKGARIGGIVASTLGGAGLGVGTMELFGNELIGGKVSGQKGASKKDLYTAQLKAIKDQTEKDKYKADLKIMVDACAEQLVIDDCDLYKELYSAI